MKKESKYDKWLKLLPWEIDKKASCPDCNDEAIDYYFIGDLEKRMGFCMIWCNECLKGINISRTRIPKGAKAMSFNEAEKEGQNRIPTFQFISR
jgi:transcription elongation factor Elf1